MVKAFTHTKTISISVQPELHDLPNSLSNFRIRPVEIGLADVVQMKIVFLSMWIPFPC